MDGAFFCLECGREIGGRSGLSVYKHVVNCMHLESRGIENIANDIDSMDVGAEYKRRVKEMLRWARAEQEPY